jgi:hypothetical protein
VYYASFSKLKWNFGILLQPNKSCRKIRLLNDKNQNLVCDLWAWDFTLTYPKWQQSVRGWHLTWKPDTRYDTRDEKCVKCCKQIYDVKPRRKAEAVTEHAYMVFLLRNSVYTSLLFHFSVYLHLTMDTWSMFHLFNFIEKYNKSVIQEYTQTFLECLKPIRIINNIHCGEVYSVSL